MKMIPSRDDLEFEIAEIIRWNIKEHGDCATAYRLSAIEIVDLLEKRTSVSTGEYLNIP